MTLDLAPAILLDDTVCGECTTTPDTVLYCSLRNNIAVYHGFVLSSGTRYVLGAESTSALAQAAAALVAEDTPGAVERARVDVRAAGLALEAARPPPAPAALPASPAAAAAPLNASLPYAAVNLVQQRVDALASHADSRGGGLASRF